MRYEEFETGGTELRAVVSNGFERLDVILGLTSLVGGPLFDLIKQVTMKGGGASELTESFYKDEVKEGGEIVKVLDTAKVASWCQDALLKSLQAGSREIVATFLNRTQVWIPPTIEDDVISSGMWSAIDLDELNVKQILSWTLGTIKVQYSEFFPTASLSQNSQSKAADIAKSPK